MQDYSSYISSFFALQAAISMAFGGVFNVNTIYSKNFQFGDVKWENKTILRNF